jgi:hypothetical protein
MGYRPRFSALMGAVAETYGNGRRMVQTFCASVLQIPISLGAIQKVLDRVVQAIEPHYRAMATQARHALVNYIDETYAITGVQPVQHSNSSPRRLSEALALAGGLPPVPRGFSAGHRLPSPL